MGAAPGVRGCRDVAGHIRSRQPVAGPVPQQVAGGRCHAAIASAGIAASRVELEITETVLLQNSEATLAAAPAARLGVRMSMDDFGTGYSSLSYLRSFPFDKIKIDRSFVRDLERNQDALAIIRAVSGLGMNLGMVTTVEGVETKEQLDQVRAELCTEAQGYLFSHAAAAKEIPRLLSTLGKASKARSVREDRSAPDNRATRSPACRALGSSMADYQPVDAPVGDSRCHSPRLISPAIPQSCSGAAELAKSATLRAVSAASTTRLLMKMRPSTPGHIQRSDPAKAAGENRDVAVLDIGDEPMGLARLMVDGGFSDVDARLGKETVLHRPEIDDVERARQRRLLVGLVDGVGTSPPPAPKSNFESTSATLPFTPRKPPIKKTSFTRLKCAHAVHGRSLRHVLARHRVAGVVLTNRCEHPFAFLGDVGGARRALPTARRTTSRRIPSLLPRRRCSSLRWIQT
jgi:hypothetical protein